MKTIDKRWRCAGCNAVIGRVDGATLAIDGQRILLTPTGAHVQCPNCRAERVWHLAHEPRRSGTRRATVHIGGS